jgi:hypothetical protein
VKAIAILAIATAAYYAVRLGFSNLFADRTIVARLRAAAWPDLATSSIVFVIATYVCMLAAHALLLSGLASREFTAKLLVAAACMSAVLVANPVSTARYGAGSILLSFACLLGAFSSAPRTRVSMVATLYGLLFVFPILDAFRRERVSASRDGFFAEYAGNGDYDAFAQIANSLQYVSTMGPDWGRQLLGVILFWVPRSAWQDKPVDTGALLAEFRGYSYINLSAPIWAEAIVALSWVGLVVVLFGLGYLSGAVDARIAPALLTRKNNVWAVLGGIVPFYSLIILRGSLLQAAGGLAAMLICLALIGRRTRRDVGMAMPNARVP